MSIQEQPSYNKHTQQRNKPNHYAYMPVVKVGIDQKYLYGFSHCKYGSIGQLECCALHLETM